MIKFVSWMLQYNTDLKDYFIHLVFNAIRLLFLFRFDQKIRKSLPS
jgi:hypothetical protein